MLRIFRKFKRKVGSLRAHEREFAMAAFVLGPVVHASLRTVGLRRTLDWVERASMRVRDREPMSPARAQYLIDGIARYQPLMGRCLPRALVQYGLQRRRGTDVRFVIGVRRPEEHTLDAHAWVESSSPRSTEFDPILTVGAS